MHYDVGFFNAACGVKADTGDLTMLRVRVTCDDCRATWEPCPGCGKVQLVCVCPK